MHQSLQAPRAAGLPPVAPEADVRALVRLAVRLRRPLRARYDGMPVVVWPYALGWRGPMLYVRALIVGGGGGDERSIFIHDLRLPRLAERGGWVAPGTDPILALSFFSRLERVCDEYAPWVSRGLSAAAAAGEAG
jgi:hypothetical protein